MFLVRANVKQRVKTDSEAAEDIFTLRDGESGVSVYRVHDVDEAEELVVLHEMMSDHRPGKVDYLLLPESLLEPLGVAIEHESVLNRLGYLSDRHFEIRGISAKTKSELASAVKADGAEVRRLTGSRVKEIARDCFDRHADVDQYVVRDEWLSLRS